MSDADFNAIRRTLDGRNLVTSVHHGHTPIPELTGQTPRKRLHGHGGLGDGGPTVVDFR